MTKMVINRGNNNANKLDNNVGGVRKEKNKVVFPCKLCKEDHLTHQCAKLEESQHFLA
jgi:hypothetical protein